MVPPVIINIGMNLILIPKFGLMGAVWSTVVAYGVGLVFALVIGRRYFPIPIPVKAFTQISIACLIMAGVVMAVPVPGNTPDFIEILIKAAVGIFTYGLFCFSMDTAGCRAIIQNIYYKIRSGKKDASIEAAS